MAASVIETSTVEIGDLSAYVARPRNGGKAGMLLLPMATGIGQQVRDFAEDIAAAGMTAVSWDPWHGPSTDDTPMAELIVQSEALHDETCLAEMGRLVSYMTETLGLERVGVIGWCLGGRFALLLAARDQRLVNVVAYHPTVPIPLAPNHELDAAVHAERIEVPVMVLYPKADVLVSWSSYTKLRDALEQRSTGPSILHVYPGAEHGFSANARHSNLINKDAQALSWPQVLAFCQTTTS